MRAADKLQSLLALLDQGAKRGNEDDLEWAAALREILSPAPPEAIARALARHLYLDEKDVRRVENFVDLASNPERLERNRFEGAGAFVFGWRAAEAHRRGEGGR